MYLHVDEGDVTLCEPSEFTRFHVRAGGDTEALDATLRSTGWGASIEPGRAAISIPALRAAARELGVGDDWESQFSAMVAYAARKGWLSDDGHSLTAHVEVSSTA